MPGPSPAADAVALLAAASAEGRGAVYTRREVVEFILDLSGYTTDRPLHTLRLLEPSFGDGDFLEVVVDRLLSSWQVAGRPGDPFTLAPCIRAVELHASSFAATRDKTVARLMQAGLDRAAARRLADAWLMRGDFLLTALPGAYDFAVGNPPYVRQELIPRPLIAEYRLRYRTVFDRADIYIPFIERSLTLLGRGGTLGFICADRWMKNRYGGPLRQMVAEGFHLKAYVDMTDTPAFRTDVVAYPAITIITRERPGKTRVAYRPAIEQPVLDGLARAFLHQEAPSSAGPVREMAGVAAGAQPWILRSPDQLTLIRRLERDFPLIEGAGCRVGIGVATGADQAFIAPYRDLDVEPDRKLPLAMTRDIRSGEVRWCGLGIVNPFAAEGGLVDLQDYPRLKAYLEARKERLMCRHVARKAPARWYRTIDRIDPSLARTPKLLIPDIKGEAQVVYESGCLYPHHNLYHIVSTEWDLRALQAVLRSGIARAFVSVYATRMRGGYLRFQAQYLRRIRIPHWRDVRPALRTRLVEAAARDDTEACNGVAARLYGLSPEERAAIGSCET